MLCKKLMSQVLLKGISVDQGTVLFMTGLFSTVTLSVRRMAIQPPVTFIEMSVNLSGSQNREKSPFSVSQMQFIQGIRNCLHCDYFFGALLLEPGKSCAPAMGSPVTVSVRLLTNMEQPQIKIKKLQSVSKTPFVSRGP
jgi:hypothetical protein